VTFLKVSSGKILHSKAGRISSEHACLGSRTTMKGHTRFVAESLHAGDEEAVPADYQLSVFSTRAFLLRQQYQWCFHQLFCLASLKAACSDWPKAVAPKCQKVQETAGDG